MPGPGRLVVVALLSLGVACTTYRDQLARGQRAFEQNEHDRTLAILRDLEPDVGRLSQAEQAEYAYLRGLTDYRIGYRPDARHWLALAKAYEESSPGMLPADWKVRLHEALDELNAAVSADGYAALTSTREGEPKRRAPARDAGAPPKDEAPIVPAPVADAGVNPAAK